MDPAVIKALATGVAVALPPAIILFALGWFRRDRAAPAWLGGLAIAASFAAGSFIRFGTPVMPPRESTHWLPWVVAAALAWGLLESVWRAPTIVRWLIRAAVLGACLAAVSRSLLFNSWGPTEAAAWLGAFGIGGLIVWAGADCLARSNTRAVAQPSAWSSTAVLFGAAAASAGTLIASDSLKQGENAGFLAAALGVALAVSLWRPKFALGPAGAAILGVTLPVLWLMGAIYSGLTPLLAALLALPIPIGALVPVAKDETWKRGALRVALAAIPAVIAIAIAGAKAAERAADPYDY
jgi:hypothetical protein